MATEKNCRYGHGPLARDPEIWSLPLVQIVQPNPGGQGGSLINANSVWTCTILVCKTCGYMELEDKDIV